MRLLMNIAAEIEVPHDVRRDDPVIYAFQLRSEP